MDQKLIFTSRLGREEKVFRWPCGKDGDLWEDFSSGLCELWPNEKLPSPGFLAFRDTDKGMELLCRKPLVINGVSVRNRVLKPGDRIILGPLRLFFNAVESIKEPESPPSPKTSAAGELPGRVLKLLVPGSGKTGKSRLLPAAIVIAIAAAAVTAGCIAIPKITKIDESGTMVERPEQASVQEVYVPKEDSDKLIVVPPGGAVPEFDLDILFIHAHPDDEALDFGILLALAESAGLKTGLITFTDGSSGLDIYPERIVTSPYPDYELEGDELAGIRAGELARAAEVLGIDLLIRLGLQNHPYNGLEDELKPDEVLEIWGGMETLAGRLVEIINRTSPETMAAPDVPGPAREHFEHEAVGVVAAEVMDRMQSGGLEGPVRFITCIDPRQNHLYPEASMVDAEQTAGDISLRDVQLSALSMHKTQNDAVNVGTGFLPGYPAEYYQIQQWNQDENWDDWIAFGRLTEQEFPVSR